MRELISGRSITRLSTRTCKGNWLVKLAVLPVISFPLKRRVI